MRYPVVACKVYTSKRNEGLNMTKRESAIVSAYTGFLCGNFSDMHKYAEELFGCPIFSHQFGDKAVANKLKELSNEDFVNLIQGVKYDMSHRESNSYIVR